jgi:hypothetical protein
MQRYVSFLGSCPSSLDSPDRIHILLPLVGKQPDIDYSEHLTVDYCIIACSYGRCWKEAWVKVSERPSKALTVYRQSNHLFLLTFTLFPSRTLTFSPQLAYTHPSSSTNLLHHTNLHHSFFLTQHPHHNIFKHVFPHAQDLFVRLRRHALSFFLVVVSRLQEDALSHFHDVFSRFEDVCHRV